MILSAQQDRRFEFNKSGQLFIRVHNEPLAMIAMCVSNSKILAKVLLVRHAAPHVEIAFATIKGNKAGAEPAAYPRNSAR